jgi:hypothetical protein
VVHTVFFLLQESSLFDARLFEIESIGYKAFKSDSRLLKSRLFTFLNTIVSGGDLTFIIEDKDRLSVDQLSVRRVSEISHIYQLREISGTEKSAKSVKINLKSLAKSSAITFFPIAVIISYKQTDGYLVYAACTFYLKQVNPSKQQKKYLFKL